MGGERSSTRRFSRVVLLVATLIIAVSLQGLTWGLVLEHGKTPIIGGPEVTEEDKITTSEAGPPDRVSILIHMTPGADSMPMQGFVNSQRAFVQYRYKKVLPNVVNVRNFPINALNGLLAIPGVERWEEDGTVHMHLNDSTPLINGLQSQITGAGYSADGSGVRVCVLDTGIDSDSAMYSARIDTSAGWDFVNDDNNPEDDHGHGSHVAGIAVGGTGLTVDFGCPGSEPFQGVAPKATLIGIKVLDASGSGSFSDVIAGINYGADQSPSGGRCDVINLSLGGGLFTGTCDGDSAAAAANNAVANGVVVVASSGNDGASDSMGTPACGKNVISVGATYDDDYPNCEFPTQSSFEWCTSSFLGLICLEYCTDSAPSVDQIGCYSNQSPVLDVTAPGCSTLSADFGNSPDGKVDHCGTSMAAPHVAGLAALLLNADPLLTPTDVRQLIRDGAIDLGPSGHDSAYGYGRIDVIESLSLVGPSEPECAVDGDCPAIDACTPGKCVSGICDNTSNCDDGDMCNGADFCDADGICQAGTPVTCDTGLQCDPNTGQCVALTGCTGDPDCDDGLYCNGAETCVEGTCQAGTPPCDDGVGCTVDTCDEVSDTCSNIPSHAPCDNGIYCDGVEFCDEVNDCQAGTPVNCLPGYHCDPNTDQCEPLTGCTGDPDCDDGLYCNGAETCVEGTCQAGTPPCDDGVGCTVDTCDEVSDTCSNIPSHAPCDNGIYCDGVEFCDEVNDCQAGTPANCLPGYHCDPNTDQCEPLPECTGDADCDNGNFCDGAETCVEQTCQGGDDPCPGEGCDEIGDVCVGVDVACGGNKAPCIENSDCCSNRCKGGTCRGN